MTPVQHLKRLEALQKRRANFDDLFQEIAEYIHPKRADFQRTIERGAQRTHRGTDSTPQWAATQLANALHGALTGPAQPWFVLEPVNPALMEDEATRRWYEAATEIMREVYTDPQTNFQSQIHEVYLEIVAFGTGCLYVGLDEESGGVSFSSRPLSEIYLGEDFAGRVDTVYRSYKMTARQALQAYPQTLSDKAQRMAEIEPDTEIKFLHAVTPHPNQVGNWHCEEIEVDAKALVNEFTSFGMPYLTPRWTKVAGEAYGRSPALEALPDIRMLMAMSRTTIAAAEKAVFPPLIVPNEGFLEPINTAPGSLIYTTDGFTLTENRTITPLQIGDPRLGVELIQRVNDQIIRDFNVEVFNSADRANMTATEVMIRQQERNRLIGPMIGRLQTELLDPLLVQTFRVLASISGFFPPPTPLMEEQGGGLNVKFVSQASKALRADETRSIQTLLSLAGPIAQTDPSVVHYLDGPQMIKRLADAVGVPSEIIRSDQEAQAKAQAAAQQQQQMMQMQIAAQQAQTAKTAAEAGSEVAKQQ
ncbi:MAG: portal protein [Pseudomonadota bacterium]